MKKLAVVIFLLVPLFFAIQESKAYPLEVGDLIYLLDGPGTTNGGIFKVYADDGTFLFDTFCVETDETLSTGSSSRFKVGGINDYASLGGSNTDSNDPLDIKTAWLFYHFTIGDLDTLAGQSDGYFNAQTGANELQQAIWYIEQESGGVNNYLVALAGASGWTDINGVRVINLLKKDSAGNFTLNAQDLLITVPEPGILILLGIAMSAVGLAARRFRI